MAGNPIPGGAGGLMPEGGGDLAKGANQQVDNIAGRSASDSGDKAKDAAADSQAKGPAAGAGSPAGPAGGAGGGAGALAMAGGPAAAAQGGGSDKQTGGEAEPDLGAGGTSEAGDEGGKGSSGMPGGAMSKNMGAAAAVPAAGAAAQLMVLMMFLKMLKGAMLAMAALMANLWNLIWGAIVTAAKAVAGFFMSIGSAIAGAVGGAVSAVAGAMLGGGVFVLSAVMVIGAGYAAVRDGTSNAQRDGVVVDCGPDAQQAMSGAGGDEPVTGDNVENAQTVYSVFSAWGMPDENVAGILGNWDAESGIDPTSVEGIFDEPYRIGPRKQDAWDSGFSHMAYLNGDPSGIGLGQWTRGRNTNLLAYADKHNADWYTLEIQLGFMISADEGADANVVKHMINNSIGSPGDAAVYFHDNWERSADTSMAHRKEMANKWMGMMGGWTADEQLANSILEQAETTVEGANDSRRRAIKADCRGAESKGSVALTQGGLNMEEAQALIDIYLEEGNAFLKGRYGSGGPGACGDDKAMNCVSFSTYFVNKYTSFQQYAPGNGVDTASSMASMMGKETTHTPTAYSVASGPGSGPAGHTFVVLGVTDDYIILGEAGYCSNRGSVRQMPIEEATSGKWEYVDVTDLMLPEDEVYTS